MITGKARDRMEKLFENIGDLERHLPTKALDKIISKEQRRPGVQEDILYSVYFETMLDDDLDKEASRHLSFKLQEIIGNGVRKLPPFGWDGLDYLDALYELGPYEPGSGYEEDDDAA